MFGSVFTFSLKDFFRVNRVIVWVAVGLVTGLVALLWNKYSAASASAVYSQVTTLFVYRIVALSSAVFTSMVLSQEIEQKTVIYLLTRPVPRTTLIVGRWLAGWATAVVLSMVCLLFVFGFTFHTSLIGAFVRDLMVIAIGAGAYGALFLLFSLVFKRSIIYSLLFAFGWETLVPNMPGDLRYLSVYSYIQVAGEPDREAGALVSALTGGAANNLVSVPVAWFVLIGFIVIVMGVNLAVFSRAEIIAHEESA